MQAYRIHRTLYRNRRGLFLAAVSLLLPFGCYQRVVNDQQGTYRGEIYDSNLPSDTKGIWQDPAYGPRSTNDQPTATELNDSANKAYQQQLKDLGTSSGKSGD